MNSPITPDMPVSEIIKKYPKTYDVFCRYGCPDMRSGFFSFMARIMKLKWAARVHHIPLKNLLIELNEIAMSKPPSV